MKSALGVRDMIGITSFFRAHETSLQWWGHRVGWNSYHDQWLSEGFAQFSGNLYVQVRQNTKEYLSRLRQDKEELKGRDQRNRMYESLGPIFTYQVQDAGDGKWKVSGRVVQSAVTDTWKNILPIYLVSSGRSIRLGWVRVSGPESTFQFMMPMTSKPEKITLNENEDVLADIKQ